MRGVIGSLLPDGAVWRPAHGGDLDRLLDGVAEGKEGVLVDLSALAHIRDPYKCPAGMLGDLERELGISSNHALTETQRRKYLVPIRYKRQTLSTAQKLQYALDKAGFGYGGYGLKVTPNSPPADPELTGWYYTMQAHDWPSIYCAGSPLVGFAGQYNVRYYLASGGEEELETPPESWWPLLFFVGGTPVRTYEGRIRRVTIVDVPKDRRQELHRIILRIKPMGIWAALLVRYV